VAVSRSGETTETLRACEAFRAAQKGQIVTLSNYPGTALTRLGDLNLVFPSGQEQSIAQTRAFTSLYLAGVYLISLWNGRRDWLAQLERLPEVAARVLKEAQPLTEELGASQTLDRFYFLGGGSRYGLACEFSLKMKEMSLTHSEPFHFLEFRHGPKSMITSSALVVGLRSETLRAQESAVLEEMRGMGARVLVIGDQNADVNFSSQIDEPLRNVLYLPVGQLLGYARSMSKGLNPDKPENLGAVVRLTS
jgi:glucosamine--fructose-6-phosphate aminotransferase (isomerizing)